MAAENDFWLDGTSEKGGQDVLNSGWFEVKKKSRSSSKHFTSNRMLVEVGKKGPMHLWHDGVVESDLPPTPVCLIDNDIENQEFPQNNIQTMPLQSSGKMELVNTASVTGKKPETSFDGKKREPHEGISSKKQPANIDHGMNTKDAGNMVTHPHPEDPPRFKWGNLDEEDLQQSQEVEIKYQTQMDDSSKLGTLGRALDSTICLEGGKQSSAKELKDVKIKDASFLVVQGNFSLNASNFPCSQPQVHQNTEEATEEGVNSISQNLTILDGNPDQFPLLNSTLTDDSSKRPGMEEQVESESSENTLTNKITSHTTETPDSVGQVHVQTEPDDTFLHVAAGDSERMSAAEAPIQCETADYEKMVDGEKSGKERSMDFSLAASMLMDKFEDSESGESKERFRQRLWCYLFENLNRAIDELYFLCELECDMEQIQEVLLVNEAGLDFIELKSRVEGFDKVKNLPFTPRTGNDGNSLSARVEHRRPHAIAWEVRRMACSPNRAEILSSSLEVFKKVQQETAQKDMIRQGKRRDAARLLPIEQGAKELSSKLASSKELGSSVKEVLRKSKGKQSPLTTCSDCLNHTSINVERKKADVLKVTKDFSTNPDAIPNFDSSTISVPKVTMGLRKVKCTESCESQGSNSVSKMGCKVVQQMPTESVSRALKTTAKQIDKNNKASIGRQTRTESERRMQIFVGFPHGPRQPAVALQVDPLQNLGHLKSLLLPGQAQSVLDAFYISYGGRALQDHSRLADCGISTCSMVEFRVRALGGGGDGGATGAESRDCYLNMYATKKPDKVDPNEARLAKWCRCTLSSEALKPPCVVDLLGNLYNKEALVSALLEKNLPKELRHIKGLKDMITIHLSPIPGISPDEETSSAKFQCPVSGQELNGKYRFFALRACGHVLSAKALKEVQTYTCLVCHEPFNDTEKIVINGTDEEVKLMRQKIEDQRVKARDKKEKKARNGQSEETKGVLISHESENVEFANGEQKSFSSGVNGKRNMNGLLLEAPEDVPVKSKGSDSVHEPKKFKAADHLPPNATKEVYASIFTSSSKDFKETYSCRSLPIGRN